MTLSTPGNVLNNFTIQHPTQHHNPMSAPKKPTTLHTPVLELSEEVQIILSQEAEITALKLQFGHDAAKQERRRLQIIAEQPASTLQDHAAYLAACDGTLEAKYYAAKDLHNRRLHKLRSQSWHLIKPLIQDRVASNKAREKEFTEELDAFTSRWNVVVEVASPIAAAISTDEALLNGPVPITESIAGLLK